MPGRGKPGRVGLIRRYRGIPLPTFTGVRRLDRILRGRNILFLEIFGLGVAPGPYRRVTTMRARFFFSGRAGVEYQAEIFSAANNATPGATRRRQW